MKIIKLNIQYVVAIALASSLMQQPLLADTSAAEVNASKVEVDEPRVMFEGALMLDASQFDGVYADGGLQSELHLRRAIFGLSADLSPSLDVELSVKLEEGLNNVEIKDANLRWKLTKKQRLILGQQKEPVGLESNQSSKQMPATERSMASSLFTPDRHIGVSYNIRESRYNAVIGVFEASDEAGHNRLAASARVTVSWLMDGEQTIHLGGSTSYRDLGETSLKLKDEGGVKPAENIISSKRYDIKRQQIMALEVAWLRGPLWLQSEWIQTDMKSSEVSVSDPSYNGSYIQAAWLLGDVRRKYNNGKFKLSGLKASTAWELVVRAEQADLRDANDGVRAQVLMAGVNYYRSKRLRIMGNVLTAETTGPGADADTEGRAATMRLQYTF